MNVHLFHGCSISHSTLLYMTKSQTMVKLGSTFAYSKLTYKGQVKKNEATETYGI